MLLYHYTKKENVSKILQEGLIPKSSYELFTELRKNVVFCWLSPDDQKIFSGEDVCLEVSVNEEDCIIAEMDYISLAMMYKYGGRKNGGMNIPVNEEASKLFVKLYEVTSMPISRYEKGNFFTPEVLVKGIIKPENIRLFDLSSK
jgi:hypothetical protein